MSPVRRLRQLSRHDETHRRSSRPTNAATARRHGLARAESANRSAAPSHPGANSCAFPATTRHGTARRGVRAPWRLRRVSHSHGAFAGASAPAIERPDGLRKLWRVRRARSGGNVGSRRRCCAGRPPSPRREKGAGRGRGVAAIHYGFPAGRLDAGRERNLPGDSPLRQSAGQLSRRSRGTRPSTVSPRGREDRQRRLPRRAKPAPASFAEIRSEPGQVAPAAGRIGPSARVLVEAARRATEHHRSGGAGACWRNRSGAARRGIRLRSCWSGRHEAERCIRTASRISSIARSDAPTARTRNARSSRPNAPCTACGFAAYGIGIGLVRWQSWSATLHGSRSIMSIDPSGWGSSRNNVAPAFSSRVRSAFASVATTAM